MAGGPMSAEKDQFDPEMGGACERCAILHTYVTYFAEKNNAPPFRLYSYL